MTEEDAKTKWCPSVRLTAEAGEWHTNRPGGDSPGDSASYRCIASACMAWRWTGEPLEYLHPSRSIQMSTPYSPGANTKDSFAGRDTSDWRWKPRYQGPQGPSPDGFYVRENQGRPGFCGLAGAPQ